MRILWVIMRRFLTSLIRQKTNLLWMILMPLLITFLFGILPNMGTSATAVAVVDQDQSAVSRAYIDALAHTDGVQVKPIAAGNAIQTLRDMQASLVLTLPKGLGHTVIEGQTPTLGWLKSPSADTASSSGGFTLVSLQQQVIRWTKVGEARVEATRSQGIQDPTALSHAFALGLQQGSHASALVNVTMHSISGGMVLKSTLTDTERSVAGFATMFIIFTLFSVTGEIFREKQRGTWNRLKVSSAARYQVIGGYGAAYFLIGWIQFLLMRELGIWLFHATIPLAGWVILAVSLYILGVTGIALCIAGVAKSGEQHRMIGVFFAIATTQISGAYWPIDIEPVWMQHLAWFVPQTWALEAFKLAAVGASTLAALAIPMVVLAAFAVIFLFAGMIQLRYS